VGLTATAIFAMWSLIAYRANAEAEQAAGSDAVVAVTRADGIWRFEPGSTPREPTLVFFPGSLVDPRAYAPLAKAVAREGHRVIMVELPRRGAFGGAESPELTARIGTALGSVGDSGSVVLGGHSRGAVVASATASRNLPSVKGLVLIGTSHPRDVNLSKLGIPVTKIAGTRDGLASPGEVKQNASLLPPHTRWIWVEGGNHSQFGWYGFQPMDKWPRIDAAKQRAIMIAGVLDLMRVASPAATSSR
jgi:pimeloyl-ACP methyl ester carboxylesterase